MVASSYLICRVLNIPIRAHITLLIFLPLLALYGGTRFLFTITLLVGYFVGIALHELGHAVVAMRYGCTVRQILLMPIGGVAQLSHFPADPGAEVRIALAGPAVSLALFGACGLVYIGLAALGLLPTVALTFGFLAFMNLALALFNLLPSFPMDGGRVFRALMTPRMGRVAATRLASRIGQWMAIAFGLFGLIKFNILLIAIAVFVHRAAGAEYRMVRIQAMIRAAEPRGGVGSVPPEDILVSPPPYAKSEQGKSIWSELLGLWGQHR